MSEAARQLAIKLREHAPRHPYRVRVTDSASGDAGSLLVGFLQDPSLLLGIPLALAGAVCMSLGAQFQHQGVAKVERLDGVRASAGLTWSHLRALATRPSWLAGTLLLGLAVICQLGAISVAPLMVIQPIGVVALLLTTVLNSRRPGIRTSQRSWVCIAACIGGIAIFVTVAARYATRRPITDPDVATILVILLAVAIATLGVWVVLRRKLSALFYVGAAGVLYGFVATLAKILVDRVQEGQLDWFLILAGAALAIAAVLGGYFLQCAHSSGSPELVVAGLTVVDPLVAVVLAMTLLGEASAMPLWTSVVLVPAAAVSIWGVTALAGHLPGAVRPPQKSAAPSSA